MPKLWDESIEAHRRAVRDTVLDAAAALASERGVRALTMSELAQVAGIGRATLYRHFADVDAVLTAWHERLLGEHLHRLGGLRDGPGSAAERLDAVLEAYALIQYEQPHGTELAATLHQGEHVARARRHLTELLSGLIKEGAADGDLRGDVPALEVAEFCLHALTAAGDLGSRAAVRRLVDVTLAGVARRDEAPR